MTLLRVHGEVTLGADPDLRFTQAGKPVCSFSAVASKSKKDENDNWVDDKQAWVRVTVWDKLAEHVAGSLKKGDRAVIVGDLYEEEYEKDGVKRKSLNVTAYEVGASVRFAEVVINKAQRSNTSAPATAGAADPWQSDSSALPF